MVRDKYIDLHWNAMIRVCLFKPLFPSVMMAQAILESSTSTGDTGGNILAMECHNHFGIKSDKSWKGKVKNVKTGEYLEGNYEVIQDGFRCYKSDREGFKDRIDFLTSNPRYEQNGVFAAKNYEQQADALQRAGYATAPNYAEVLKDLIWDNELDWMDTYKKRWEIAIYATGSLALIALVVLGIWLMWLMNKEE